MPNYWFDHVHLNSPDPPGTAQFYEKTLGAAKKADRQLPDGRTLIVLSLSDVNIYVTHPRTQPLAPGIPPNELGLEHFAVATDNIEQAVEELKAQGAKFLTGITHAGNLKFAFYLAPDKVLIELIERSK